MYKASFGVAKPKLLLLLLLLLLKEVLSHVKNFFNKISCFKHETFFKIFTLNNI